MSDLAISGNVSIPNFGSVTDVGGASTDALTPVQSGTNTGNGGQTAPITDGFDQPAKDYSTLGGGASGVQFAQAQTNQAQKGSRLGTTPDWSVPGTTNPTDNTIVCDGKGGVAVQLDSARDPQVAACTDKCTTQHENIHLGEAVASTPNVCQGQPQGAEVAVRNSLLNGTECRAHTAEIDCLKNELPTASAACQPIIQNAITTLEPFRARYCGRP
jgi:hypothetical protein